MARQSGKFKAHHGTLGTRAALASCCLLLAMGGGVGATNALGQDGPGAPPPPPMQSNRPPMERAFRGGPGRGMGKWWDNPDVAKDLNLQADQKQKMDAIFDQSRTKLIDQHASLQKEETALEPLMNADSPDESKILAQIDKIAQARAELEKSNARMLLAVRQVLTQEQWTKLRAAREARMAKRGNRPDGGPGGPPPE
jgi:Spy/CpxP family protein refolding chaperone